MEQLALMAKGTIFVVSKIFMAHQLIVVQCADDHCAGRMVEMKEDKKVQAEIKLSPELEGALKVAIQDAVQKIVNDSKKENSKWPDYMNKGMAAKYLGISNNTLNEWIDSDSVPFKKIGRSYRFNRNELDKFMATK